MIRGLISKLLERRQTARRRRRALQDLCAAQDTLADMELQARRVSGCSEEIKDLVREQFHEAIEEFERSVAIAHEWGAL